MLVSKKCAMRMCNQLYSAKNWCKIDRQMLKDVHLTPNLLQLVGNGFIYLKEIAHERIKGRKFRKRSKDHS